MDNEAADCSSGIADGTQSRPLAGVQRLHAVHTTTTRRQGPPGVRTTSESGGSQCGCRQCANECNQTKAWPTIFDKLIEVHDSNIRSNKYTGRPTRLSLTLQPARSPDLQSPATISISCMVTGAGLMLDLCLLRAKPHRGWIRGSPTRGNVFSDRLMGSLPPLHNQWFCGTDAV